MSHPSTTTCTNVIASIAYLCTGTWVFGNPFEEVKTHLDGIEAMVKQRGMESLGVYQFGRTVRKQNLLLSAIRAQPTKSTFDLDYNQVLNTFSVNDTKHVSPLYCPQKTFAQLLQSKRFNEDTVHILYNAKVLIDLVIDFDEGAIEEADFNITLFHIKNELERHISANNPQSASDRNWVFECCRLTVVIVLEAIETAQPLLSSNSALTLSLVSALEKADIGDNWGELSGKARSQTVRLHARSHNVRDSFYGLGFWFRSRACATILSSTKGFEEKISVRSLKGSVDLT
ncbi:hypothetical protein G7Y89_g7339 [Cudoniella acicularis]|uniref:Uncharacterized protein n=1 Tax=Cudoniella acicularis TaxID=354080 RepID=A0A8H4RIP0_9HELO|nr:hypothetical protein G7Y89_g7339 [Cudoniella acicularis]